MAIAFIPLSLPLQASELKPIACRQRGMTTEERPHLIAKKGFPSVDLQTTTRDVASRSIPSFDTGHYFAMRLIRRILPVAIPRPLRKLLPGMRKNFGSVSVSGVVGLYDKNMSSIDKDWIRSRCILEVGIGETNSSCYELAARGATQCYAFEPFVPIDLESDRKLLELCSSNHNVNSSSIAEKVTRLMDISVIAPESVDMIISNSVLEHVADLGQLFSDLWRVLRPGGSMLHIVDYRDHFFTYPYHHLKWSEWMWQTFLNPGDLPRWRIGDHIEALSKIGFEITKVEATALPAEFEKIRDHINPSFARYSEYDLSTAYGVIFVKKPVGSSQK